MDTHLAQIEAWLEAKEDEHLEFKEAKNRYDFEKLVKYCAALANEGGGNFVLGITDKRPRRVVGSQAFQDLERVKAGLIERLRLRIDAYEVHHLDGRVVVFAVPSRPLGTPVQYEGAFWMRGGEELTPMTTDFLKRILAEVGPDFSAEICAGQSLRIWILSLSTVCAARGSANPATQLWSTSPMNNCWPMRNWSSMARSPMQL